MPGKGVTRMIPPCLMAYTTGTGKGETETDTPTLAGILTERVPGVVHITDTRRDADGVGNPDRMDAGKGTR